MRARARLGLGAAAVLTLSAVLTGCADEQVQVGTCAQWEQLADADPDEVQVVDCAEEHTAQFVGHFEAEFEEFPGEVAVDAMAEPGCLEAFAGFVGVDYADSELRLDWFRPTQQTWSQTGGRDVWCVAYLPEGTATGGFEGTGR